MVNSKLYPLPKLIIKKRKIIEDYLNIKHLKILEVGALDNPTYRVGEANVKYLDWFTASELHETLRNNPKRNVDRLVNVDYPIKQKRFSEKISDKFDLIIANHVIEHIPDVVTWIKEVTNLLATNGVLFLTIPDKNYTFDIVRSITDSVELLDCYEQDLEIPSYHQILRHIYYYRPIVAVDVWNNTVGDKINSKRLTLKEAVERAKILSTKYTDVHCHVFTHDTFQRLWSDLLEHNLINLEIKYISKVEAGSNEFYCILHKK